MSALIKTKNILRAAQFGKYNVSIAKCVSCVVRNEICDMSEVITLLLVYTYRSAIMTTFWSNTKGPSPKVQGFVFHAIITNFLSSVQHVQATFLETVCHIMGSTRGSNEFTTSTLWYYGTKNHNFCFLLPPIFSKCVSCT